MLATASRKFRPSLLAILAALAIVVTVVPSPVFSWSPATSHVTGNMWSLPSQPPNTDDPNTVVSQELDHDAAAQNAVREYWTEERMAAAEPLEIPIVSTENPPVEPNAGTSSESSNAPYMVYTDAEGQVRVHTGELPEGAALRSGPQPLAGVFPFSFTRYRLFPDLTSVYRTYPYRTIGKLFFTIGPFPTFCSASSVVSTNFSVVWTAGHCVFTPGFGFHSNFLFVPARRLGANPYGSWTAQNVLTLFQWTLGLFEYDHGALVMNRGGLTNERIGDRVGSLNFLANASRMQHWHLFGYPAPDPRFPPVNPPFDGEHQEICAATWATNDLPTGGPNDPPTIGVGCDQTGGASGGPWIVDFSGVPTFGTQVFNLLNGNNSYKYGAPNHLRVYGPYFTTGAITLHTAASNVEVP